MQCLYKCKTDISKKKNKTGIHLSSKQRCGKLSKYNIKIHSTFYFRRKQYLFSLKLREFSLRRFFSYLISQLKRIFILCLLLFFCRTSLSVVNTYFREKNRTKKEEQPEPDKDPQKRKKEPILRRKNKDKDLRNRHVIYV
jgi:hypothetical protein